MVLAPPPRSGSVQGVEASTIRASAARKEPPEAGLSDDEFCLGGRASVSFRQGFHAQRTEVFRFRSR